MTDVLDSHPSETNTIRHHENEKPLVIIHRLPTYTSTFPHCLTSSFSLLDPTTAAGTSDATTFLRSHGSAARALFCVGRSPLRKDTLDCLPCLECVISHCVGTEHIDLSECRRRGINVANVGDAFSDDVADCAVGFALDVLRKVSAAHRFVQAGSWPQIPSFPLGSRVSELAFA